MEENDWKNNSILWRINFQNNDGRAYANLRPSTASTTVHFTEAA